MLQSEGNVHIDTRQARRHRDPDDTDSDCEEDKKKTSTEARDDDSQLVFLLPKTLALMEPDLQSQMHVYRAYPWQRQPPAASSSPLPLTFHMGEDIRRSPLRRDTFQSQQSMPPCATDIGNTYSSDSSRAPPPPHIKSYARLLRSNGDSECTCTNLAWFLLTSACLSKGGQGEVIQPKQCKDCGIVKEGFVEYKNFELGVLFHSGQRHRHRHRHRLDESSGISGESAESTARTSYVQYKAYSRTCKVHLHPILGAVGARQCDGSAGSASRSKLQDEVIVLPVPYDIGASEPYCDGNGFLREPYFHDKSELGKYDGQLGLCQLAASRSATQSTPAEKGGSRSVVGVVTASTAVGETDLTHAVESKRHPPAEVTLSPSRGCLCPQLSKHPARNALDKNNHPSTCRENPNVTSRSATTKKIPSPVSAANRASAYDFLCD